MSRATTRGRSIGISTNSARLAHAEQRFGGTHSGGGRDEVEGGSGFENSAAMVRQKRLSARGSRLFTMSSKQNTDSSENRSGPAAKSSYERWCGWGWEEGG